MGRPAIGIVGTHRTGIIGLRYRIDIMTRHTAHFADLTDGARVVFEFGDVTLAAQRVESGQVASRPPRAVRHVCRNEERQRRYRIEWDSTSDGDPFGDRGGDPKTR